jgi:hypothetical protein
MHGLQETDSLVSEFLALILLVEKLALVYSEYCDESQEEV